jgi:membrane protein
VQASPTIPKPNLWTILRRTFSAWSDHNAMRLSAAMAFYAILSLAPMVVFAILLVGLVFGHSAAQQEIIGQVQYAVGTDGANAVRGILETPQKPAAGVLASVLGIVTLIFGASGVFVELRDALNTMWDVKPRSGNGLLELIRQRFATFGMVLGVGFLLLLSLLMSTATAVVGKFFATSLPAPEFVVHLANDLVSLVAIAGLFALIFKVVPETPIDWKDVWGGALATSFLFTVGKAIIALYLGKAAIASAYGAAGSMIAVTVWVYYSSLIFFFGAEFTHELAEAKNSANPARLPVS